MLVNSCASVIMIASGYCYNKNSTHWVALKTHLKKRTKTHFFSHSYGSWKSKMEMPADSVLDEGPFLPRTQLPSSFLLTGLGDQVLVSFLFSLRALILSWGFTVLTSSKPNYLLKSPPPNMPWRIRVSAYEFWRGTGMQSMTSCN